MLKPDDTETICPSAWTQSYMPKINKLMDVSTIEDSHNVARILFRYLQKHNSCQGSFNIRCSRLKYWNI